MSTSRKLVRRATQAAWLSLVLAIDPGAARAQASNTPASSTPASSTPVLAAPTDFAIPRQPLESALTAFSAATRLQVLVSGDLVRGIVSPGISGSLTPADALRGLLAGTGLAARFVDRDTVTLQPAPAGQVPGVTTLDPVQVQGAARQNAWEAPPGFVATRSTTGTKTDTPLIDTPQTVNVVTRDEIATRGAQTITQALEYTPGVNAGYYGGTTDARYDWVATRGFVARRYLDGLRLPYGARGYSQAMIDPYGLESVEVLKGPSSVLYGQNNPGGLINLVSKRPPSETLREVELQTGSHGRAQGAFDIGGPLDAQGKFSYRLTGLARDVGSQVDYLDERRIFIAPALTWRPTIDTTLTLMGQYLSVNAKGGGAPQGMPVYGTLWANPNGKIPKNRFIGEPGYDKFSNTQYSVGYAFEHRFDDAWTVRQNLRYTNVDTFSRRVQAAAFSTADYSTVSRYAWAFPEKAGVFGVDTQAQARFATGPLRHTVLFGFDYQNEDGRYQESQLALIAPLNVYNPVYANNVVQPPLGTQVDQLRNQYGVYVQDEIELGPWALMLSGRQDWADTRTSTLNAVTGARAVVNQDDTAFTGRAGLVYRFGNGLAPYVSYATSFVPTSGVSRAGTPFDPQTGQQYEVGVKYQPTGFNSFVTLSAYNLTQKNVLTPDPVDTRFSVQTGEARVRGVEVEGKASLGFGVDLVASYSYAQSKVLSANRNAAGASLVGKDLPLVPRQQAALWADYNIPDGWLAGLVPGGGVRYVGTYFGDANNVYKTPGVTLFDAALRYDLGRASPALEGAQIQLNASNLFNKEFVTACASATGCYWGAGRTVLATLRYRW